MLSLIGVLALIILVVSAFFMIRKFVVWYHEREDDYGKVKKDVKRPTIFKEAAGLFLSLLSLGLLISGGVAEISPTSIGVVENTFTGRLYTLQAGTHIWPFSQDLIPFVTKIEVYDTRRQTIEIGEVPQGSSIPDKKSATQAYGVPGGSNSPGQPVVFFRGRGYAYVNPAKITELHRRYGPKYLSSWVEPQWVTTLKQAQGQLAYDAVKNDRGAFQSKVEQTLQKQLLDEKDQEPIVIVSQLTIADYDYEEKVNSFLEGVAQKEFERQISEQQISVNQKNQQAQSIQADTDYIVKKRAAEAEQARLEAEANGRANATKIEADSAAYSVKVKYLAESNGIQQVQTALSKSPQAYLDYQKTMRWDGILPQYMFSGSPIPFMNIPMPTTPITTTGQ